MDIENNTILGNSGRNIVLETAGKVYVKVNDHYYELDFKNLGKEKNRSSSSSKSSDVIESPTVPETNGNTSSEYITTDEFERYLSNYVPVRDWNDVIATQETLKESLLGGFTEPINPMTVQSMQVVVGSKQLQFNIVNGFTDDTIADHIINLTDSSEVELMPCYIKHFVIDGPEEVQPVDESASESEVQQQKHDRLKQYCRWYVHAPADKTKYHPNSTYVPLEDPSANYYVYIKAEKCIWTTTTLDGEDYSARDEDGEKIEGATPTGIYAKTGDATFEVTTTAKELDEESGYYYFLYAIINAESDGTRSFCKLNGFTEILPGQITAYVFKTPEGDQYMDFLKRKFRIGNSNSYMDWNVTDKDTLTIRGRISSIGGDDISKLTEVTKGLQKQIEKVGQRDFYADLQDALSNGRTDIEGGLILSNLITLGYSNGNHSNYDDYYNKFRVMSGINGLAKKSTEKVPDYTKPALWFGGPAVDAIKDTLSGKDYFVDSNYINYKYSSNSTLSFSKWISSDSTVIHTPTNVAVGSKVFTITTSDNKTNVTLLSKTIEDVCLGSSWLSASFKETTKRYKRNNTLDKNIDSVDYGAYTISQSVFPQTIYIPIGSALGSDFVLSEYYTYDLLTEEMVSHTSNDDDFIQFSIPRITSNYWVYFDGNYYDRELKKDTTDISYPAYYWTTSKEGANSPVIVFNNPPSDNEQVYYLDTDETITNSTSTSYLTKYSTVNYYSDGVAKSLFRFDGSGYLANGSIKWDTEGNLTAEKLTVTDSSKIGPLEVTNSEVKVGDYFKVGNGTCEITGKLTAKAAGYSDNAYFQIVDSSGTKIADIGSQPLSTGAVDTYIRKANGQDYISAKGSICWGKVTIPDNWYFSIFDDYYSYIDGETYEITNLEVTFDFERVSKKITAHILFRDYDVLTGKYTDIKVYTKSFTQSTKITIKQADLTQKSIKTKAIHAYRVMIYLEPGGQVQSGLPSNSWIRISSGNNQEVRISRPDENKEIIKGTYIRPNGISSTFGKHSKFQWLGAYYNDNGAWAKDYRKEGGIFHVELPKTSGGDNADSIVGLEVVGYYDGAGSLYNDPGIRINTGDGWHLLIIEDGYVKVKST